METYYFERAAGGMTENDVKEIINTAGYSASDYRYEKLSKDTVSAKGDVSMNDTKLETAARKLGIKGVTVTSTKD